MRKCAIAALCFSAAVFFCSYLLPLRLLPWLAAAFCLIGLVLALQKQRWLLGFTIASFGLACGFLCFFLHAQISLVPALKLDGETLQLRGEISSYPRQYENYSRVELRLRGEQSRLGKILLYTDVNALESFEPGDEITFSAKLKRADLRYGERYDSLLSRGITMTGSLKAGPMKTGEHKGLGVFFLRAQRGISEMVDSIFPADTAAFMKSLMLGDKTDLYQNEELYQQLSRAGFLHVVAVSGMHVAFLVGLLQLLFGKTWRSSLLCLLLVWLFVLITGAPPSAMRAAVMQSLLLIAPMVRRENDPLTSLSVALAFLLLLNPFSAASAALQLSFSAMAGILCLSEPLTEKISSLFPERWAARMRAPVSVAASSLSVLAFSIPFMVWHFHSVALLSPITNILGLWAVSVCFCGAYFSCLLGLVFAPLGSLAAWLVSWFARYIILLAKTISSLSFAMLYLRTLPSYLWIVLVYALAALFAFSRLRLWIRFLAPVLLAALMLILLLQSTGERYRRQDGVIAVIDVGQGQSIAVMSKDQTLLIDCGGIYSNENAGETAGAYLISCGRKQVDVLLLTHLHEDHCSGVSLLMGMLPVRQLILPAGLEDEDGMLGKILEAAKWHGTEVLFLEKDADLSFGSIRARLFMPLQEGSANERCMTGVVSVGSYDMLFTGDSSKTIEKELLSRYDLRDLELLIVGHHGSRYASSGELLRSIGADTAVISVGYNTFGHPTHEVLERLAAYGYSIYRTDLNGTVEIFLESS